MLAEATQTARERENSIDKVLATQQSRGATAEQLADYRDQLEERAGQMKNIVDFLHTAVHAHQEMGDEPAAMIAYQGEMMLANWSETASAGRQVVFWLEEGADAETEHPFKFFTRRIRGHAGTRFQAVLVEIDDEGQPVPRGTGVRLDPPAESKPKLKGGAVSKNAGMLCKDEAFHRYLTELANSNLTDDQTFVEVKEDGAADYVRRICGVESRAELDHSRKAQLAYENKVCNPFYRWLEFDGGPNA
jgi:hypothetical protein